MGLAGQKNRARIAQDPQNTAWANNTSRFGHRILTSQGWTPGSSLGAQDASHAEHYTAASKSHIRVLLKDDNLGLGAKRGSEKAENFGLAGFAGVLGRLNGNEEDVKKEEKRQEDIQQRAYVYRKYGFMNFVSGGFLVGDKIQKGRVKEDEKVKRENKSESESSAPAAGEKKSKKRKRSGEDAESKEEVRDEQPKLKRKRKSVNLREEAAKQEVSDDTRSKSKKGKKEKKDKKNKKEKNKSKKDTTSGLDTAPSPSESPAPASHSAPPEPVSDKARRKAEKRARKEEKKLKKALKRAAKEAAQSNATANDSSSESKEESTPSSTPVSTSGTGTSTPSAAPSGLSFGAGGRHAARQRYIQQKRMASMDPQALKEIFMIKTPS